MAFNGAGVFSRLYSWISDRNNGIPIDSTRFDAELDGIAAGLSNAICRDGQTTVTAPIPFGGQRLTAVGDATAPTDALNRQSADGRYLKTIGGASAVVSVDGSTIDVSTGSYFYKTASGALTWTFQGAPPAGAIGFILELTNGGLGTQTWPASVKWPSNVDPALTSNGVDVLVFVTRDGGVTWRGNLSMRDSS